MNDDRLETNLDGTNTSHADLLPACLAMQQGVASGFAISRRKGVAGATVNVIGQPDLINPLDAAS